MLKKKIVYIFVIIILMSSVRASAQSNPPLINSKSAILMDVNTGRILYGKNIHEKRPMASTTKIMTAIVALENGNLSDIVTISPKAAKIEGSKIYLKPGEKLTLEELVYGLLMMSGNDAAVAIAEHIGKSVEGFAEIMNKKAISLGALNTNFKNPHGLDAEGHYTTAYDLALITRYGLSIPKFREILQTKHKVITNRQLYNKNRLLSQYEGGDGVKTGYTSKAGRCFVGSATRNNWQLISVVLNSPSIWRETKSLLDFGFKEYSPVNLFHKNQVIKKIDVKQGIKDKVDLIIKDDVIIPLKAGEKKDIKVTIDYKKFVIAPVDKDKPVGNLKLFFKDTLVSQFPLVTKEFIERKKYNDRLNNIIKEWIKIPLNNF
ncbi:MAG: hypothetical protein PWP21_167 [Thermosediminibacterales bacterium]|nr:hypothetical protein [Thermosediminibacterales bacterium]